MRRQSTHTFHLHMRAVGLADKITPVLCIDAQVSLTLCLAAFCDDGNHLDSRDGVITRR
jgi:hypothetical protein